MTFPMACHMYYFRMLRYCLFSHFYHIISKIDENKNYTFEAYFVYYRLMKPCEISSFPRECKIYSNHNLTSLQCWVNQLKSTASQISDFKTQNRKNCCTYATLTIWIAILVLKLYFVIHSLIPHVSPKIEIFIPVEASLSFITFV